MPSPDRADRGRQNPEDGHEVAVPPDRGPGESRSDVFLDVPALHVDELNLEVDDLEAHVSLQAEVLDLLKLNVGADVRLGRVELDIEGVDVQAQLRVRLHNIAAIVTRLLSTVDRNPQILEQLTRGVGEAVENVGAGAGTAVERLGEGTSAAVSDVGRGAGEAVESVAADAGTAVKGIGEGAGEAVEDVGRSGARAVEGADDAVGEITGDVVGSTRDDEGSGAAKKADSGRKPRARGAPASRTMRLRRSPVRRRHLPGRPRPARLLRGRPLLHGRPRPTRERRRSPLRRRPPVSRGGRAARSPEARQAAAGARPERVPRPTTGRANGYR
ncbi:hypothetical protein ABZ737_28260 [Streptomyces sp. NPDC013087]|uniref:hypothetical protein n=1 Tax=Streptomyces sp. NPDC013087 TaxID=3156694 RepID=UPI0033C7C53F